MQTDIPPTDDPAAAPSPGRSRHRALLTAAALLALALGSVAVVLELAADDTADADTAAADTADAGTTADESRVDPQAVDGDLPIDTDVPTGTALCAVVQTPETLVQREVAFLGTVTAIDGDKVTFSVEEAFKGELGDTVTLGGAEFLATPNPDNVNPITIGGRYLVAGDDGFAWGCGFTHLYDEDVAVIWRNAFTG